MPSSRVYVGGAVLLGSILAVVAVAAEAVVQVRADAGAVAAATAVAQKMIAVSWLGVGALLVWHRPGNLLGWMLLAVGVVAQSGVTGESAQRAGWVTWEASPLAACVDFLSGLGTVLVIGLIPVLYPTGRLRGGGARIVAVLVMAAALLLMLQVLRASLAPGYTWWPGGPGATVGQPWWDLYAPAIMLLGGILGSWVICGVRLLRSGYPERQQRAWLLVAVVVTVGTLLLGDGPAAAAFQTAALYLLPTAIAVGVLRYRLLDIDTALPRVVTSLLLTTCIAAGYLTATALTGALLTPWRFRRSLRPRWSRWCCCPCATGSEDG